MGSLVGKKDCFLSFAIGFFFKFLMQLKKSIVQLHKNNRIWILRIRIIFLYVYKEFLI